MGADGELIGQRDSVPGAREWATMCWLAGEVIADDYELFVAPIIGPGLYALETGT